MVCVAVCRYVLQRVDYVMQWVQLFSSVLRCVAVGGVLLQYCSYDVGYTLLIVCCSVVILCYRMLIIAKVVSMSSSCVDSQHIHIYKTLIQYIYVYIS